MLLSLMVFCFCGKFSFSTEEGHREGPDGGAGGVDPTPLSLPFPHRPASHTPTWAHLHLHHISQASTPRYPGAALPSVVIAKCSKFLPDFVRLCPTLSDGAAWQRLAEAGSWSRMACSLAFTTFTHLGNSGLG